MIESITFWQIGVFLLGAAPFWAPIVLCVIAWHLWIDYKRREWVANINWTILEIKLPQEISKTPIAMEIVLNALYENGRGKWIEQYLQGRVMNWSSLELVSIGGTIHFFMRIPDDVKSLLPASIYSQYPGIEIYEVEDYTKNVDYKDGTWELYGSNFKLTKPDPYPIMTYVDYGLGDLGVRTENQVDPIAPIIELLASMGQKEQLWFQILIQPTIKRFKIPKAFLGRQDWTVEAQNEVDRLQGDKQFNALSAGTQNTIKAIERSTGKHAFDCGIRGIYLAKEGHYDGKNIGGLLSAFNHISSADMNGFAPEPRSRTKIYYPWEDYQGIRLEEKKRKLLKAYKHRSYFYKPYKEKPFVLNTEELATIFHFPPRLTETPGFGRIESQKSEPPANLPL